MAVLVLMCIAFLVCILPEPTKSVPENDNMARLCHFGITAFSVDAADCATYYSCDADGEVVKKQCASGTVINPTTKLCVPPSQYSCRKGGGVPTRGPTNAPTNTPTRAPTAGPTPAPATVPSGTCDRVCFGGTCQLENGQEKCECQRFYTGEHCETILFVGAEGKSCSLQCENGGVCVPKNVSGASEDECYCSLGYDGSRCEKRTNPCFFVTCENNGTCLLGPNNEPVCHCKDGYVGARCSDLDPCRHDSCVNGGSCIPDGASYRCNCLPGFSGEKCENGNLCTVIKCFNGGTCDQNRAGFTSCTCNTGFGGPFCEKKTSCDVVDCQNGGECKVSNPGRVPKCECEEGFSGDLCEIKQYCGEKQSPCQNGGTCVNTREGHVCHCAFGYKGSTCETKRNCAEDNIQCQNGGTCANATTTEETKCTCVGNFIGPYCERTNDRCGGCIMGQCDTPYTTLGGHPTGHKCACDAGYTGEHCEIPWDRTLPCPTNAGKDSNNSPIKYVDTTSAKHIYACFQGRLQRLEVCPTTRYNVYSSTCLTAGQQKAWIAALANFYPLIPDART